MEGDEPPVARQKQRPFSVHAQDAVYQVRGESMGRVLFSAVVDGTVSNTLGAGFARFAKGSRVEWRVLYDEVVYVIEGVLNIRTGDKEIIGSSGCMVWLPKGTDVVYVGEDAVVAYAVYPVNWTDAHPAEAVRLLA